MFEEENVGGAVDGEVEQNTQGSETMEGSNTGGVDEGGGEEKLTPFHKHPDWIAMQGKLREYEEKLATYETRTSTPTENPTLAKLVKMGFAEDRAKEMLEIIETLAESKISPLRTANDKSQIDLAFKEFFVKHSDITEEVGTKMTELFNKLKPETQKIYANDITSLELLYAGAKQTLGSDFEAGKDAAVRNKQAKKEGGSFRGSTAGIDKEITADDIAKMSPAEFEKNRDKIYTKYREVKDAQTD